MNEQIDPRAAAADYVAGDLTAAEAAAFEQALAGNDALAKEVVFWRTIKSDMPIIQENAHAQMASVMPTPAAMANVVKHRLTVRHHDAQQRWRRMSISGWVVAAVASLLVIILVGRDLLRPQAFHDGTFANGEAVAFLEDGTAITLPARGALLGPNESAFYGDDFMPTRVPVVYENAKDVPVASTLPVVNTAVARPCLGIIIQPIALNQPDHKTGLLIVRVMGGSPASQVGIRPGDVLLSINGTPLYTRFCIAHAINSRAVGSPVQLAVYRKSENRAFEATTKLGMYFD